VRGHEGLDEGVANAVALLDPFSCTRVFLDAESIESPNPPSASAVVWSPGAMKDVALRFMESMGSSVSDRDHEIQMI
jgi:hypothetical protein